MKPLDLGRFELADPFWSRLFALVRDELLPYQWDALNDRVPGAERSFCVHNFLAAARLNAALAETPSMPEPKWTPRPFQSLPEPGSEPDPDSFYGFVFQDSDLYKWLEAASFCLASRRDPELEATVDRAISLIAAAQRPDGYLDTFYILNGTDRAMTNLKDNHELYCMGHLIEAACAHYTATGSDKLLTVARRFADYVYEKLGPGGLPGYPGHEIAEMALCRLSELTGDRRYLTLARLFIDRRGTEPHYFDREREAAAKMEGRSYTPDTDPGRYAYYQAHLPVREQTEAVGHAVRCMYLASGMADVARLTGDESLRAACLALWHSVAHEKLYITGGVGGTSAGEAFSYPYDLPSDAAYCETCAAVGLVFFARRMLALDPRAEYADVMERALYNACLAGMSLDGKSFFYSNPLEAVPEAVRRDSRLSHVDTRRQKWFGCACCPPNLARLIASLPSFAYGEDPDALWVHLYLGGRVEATFRDTPVTVRISSRIPLEGGVELTLDMPKPTSFSLNLRLPGWTDMDKADIASPAHIASEAENGYLHLSGLWRPGDRISAHLPMRVKISTASPRVRECSGKAAISRGPLVYCAEEADNGPDLHLFRLDPSRFDRISTAEASILSHKITAIDVPAKRLTDPSDRLYREYSAPTEEEAILRLIPYYAWANRAEGEMRVWIRY